MLKYHLRDFAKGKDPVAIFFQKWRAGTSCEEHVHDAIEIIYVVKGDGVNVIDGLGSPIIAGDIYIVNCGSTHSLRAGSSLELYNLLFRPSAFSPKERELLCETERFNAFFRFKPAKPPAPQLQSKLFLPAPRSAKFKELFERLHRETADAAPGWPMNCKACLILILTEICRTRELLESSGEDDVESSPLSKLLAFVNVNYLRDVPAEEMAKAACLSPNYLSEFFRAKTGMHLTKYITSLRLEKARQELLSGRETTMAELAKRCGFNDPSYFTKVFRETLGLPPGEYRDSLKK